jgi:large subunit ribosomal protein L15
MLSLNTIKPARGATHRKKRVGCGESSGHGKTSGRGHKGQKARSGGSIRLGFEGGQMPLLRKMPKRGFNNTAFKKVWGIVNLNDLEQYDNGTVVDEAFLRECGFVDGNVHGVKILGNGEITKKITAKVHAVSASAREKIEKAGGTIEILPGYRTAAPEAAANE